MIGIIDYGVGNIKAFANIYKSLDMPYRIVKNKVELTNVSKIILPGVGSFDHAMESLEQSGMREKLDDLVMNKEIPVIGICVGMQMLAKASEEGNKKGLGWIDAEVKKFDKDSVGNNPLPHMGWNSLNIKKDKALFKELEDTPRFYFLHSYYFKCLDRRNVLATAQYGDDFDCVVSHNNIYGIQCHPEKSHHNGVRLLKNFGELIC